MKQYTFTPELKAQMAGILPFNSTYEHSFTPKQFLQYPEDVQPIFRLVQYTNESILTIKDYMYKEMGETKKKIDIKDIDRKNRIYMELLFKVVKGWDNLYYLDGSECVYDGKFETFMALPEFVRTEIFTESVRISGILPTC